MYACKPFYGTINVCLYVFFIGLLIKCHMSLRMYSHTMATGQCVKAALPGLFFSGLPPHKKRKSCTEWWSVAGGGGGHERESRLS